MHKTFNERLLKAIPGGAHTYSRGIDQFPENAPALLISGKGAYITDVQQKQYLDYGMALRAVGIGYSEEAINKAAIQQILNGNNLTRPSYIELMAAELLIDLIDSVDMVKFTKNGSSAVTAAVKLARAYTGRKLIARCVNHPFFSYDDWFIGSTMLQKGIPEEISNLTKTFEYNKINSLQNLIDQYSQEIACVVMEPGTDESTSASYLQAVQALCKKNGIIFILDEMITGFRWHLKGAQYLLNLDPDLCTFGKAMANGFSVACLAGKREIMQLGSIEKLGLERTFLLSTTHGAEMSSLGAFVATVEWMKNHDVISHLEAYGKKLIAQINYLATQYNLTNVIKASGVAQSPLLHFFDNNTVSAAALRTLFMQEMLKAGVMMPWIALSFSHREKEMQITIEALHHAFAVCQQAKNNNISDYIQGEIVKPVFRQFN